MSFVCHCWKAILHVFHPKGNKVSIKRNETAHPAGTVLEMQQEISVFSNIQTLSVVYNKCILMLYSMQYPFLLNK